MAINPNYYEVDITIRRIGYKPTRWTGDPEQKTEQEVLDEFSHNKISVKVAIEKLIKYLQD